MAELQPQSRIPAPAGRCALERGKWLALALALLLPGCERAEPERAPPPPIAAPAREPAAPAASPGAARTPQATTPLSAESGVASPATRAEEPDSVTPRFDNGKPGPSIAWHAELKGDRVEIALTDATTFYHVERIELRGPGGQHIAAGDLTRQVARSFGFNPSDLPPRNMGRPFGGSINDLDFPRGFNTYANGPNYTAARTVTRAEIRLPDPAAYRRDAAAWTIAIDLVDNLGQPATAAVPAPAP